MLRKPYAAGCAFAFICSICLIWLSFQAPPALAAPPQAVDDLILTVNGSELELNWSAPRQDVEGNPVAVQYYEVFRSSNPWFLPSYIYSRGTFLGPPYIEPREPVNHYFCVTVEGETLAPLPGLLAYYPFAEDPQDQSFNDFHGALQGGASIGHYLQIGDNDQDHVILPAVVFDGLMDFTVTASLQFDVLHTFCESGFTPLHSLLNCGTHSIINTFWIAYIPNTHQWLLHIYSNHLFDFFPLVEDTWFHIAFSREGGILKLFYEGVPFAMLPGTTQPLDVDPGGALIGQDQDEFGGMFEACQSWAGGVARMRIYNRALGDAEVVQVCQQDQILIPIP